MNILFLIRDMSFIEPLGVMFLSAIAKQEGHCSSLGIINEEDVVTKVARERPDLVCMSVMSVDAEVFSKLARQIRDRCPNVLIVVGGPYATFEPDNARHWQVDAVVRGEGDWAFRDLLRAFDHGEEHENIANVSTALTSNPMRRLIEPLDDLPHPDRELVYFPGGHLANLNVKSFMASRGCAFRCAYCFNSRYNEIYRGQGTPVRRFSVRYLISEIERVKVDYGLTFVRFGDDVFAYRVDEWLEEFAEQYPRRIGLPFYCLVRPNLLKVNLVSVLRRAGCHSMSVSIEAGSERLRRSLQRDESDKTILNAFENLHNAGIQVYANAMLGLPHSTVADDLETVSLAVRCRPTYPSFTVLTPFRGTTVGDTCAKEGLIEGEYPEHTTDRSILNCFTEQQKDVQVNLVHLSIFAVRFGWLRSLILNRLIYWKPNRLFFFAWYVMKNYVSSRYIWPIKAGLLTKARLAVRALAFELSGRLSVRRRWRRAVRDSGSHANSVPRSCSIEPSPKPSARSAREDVVVLSR